MQDPVETTIGITRRISWGVYRILYVRPYGDSYRNLHGISYRALYRRVSTTYIGETTHSPQCASLGNLCKEFLMSFYRELRGDLYRKLYREPYRLFHKIIYMILL